MKLLKSKDGKLNQAVINTAILVIVLLVVLFQIYAAVIPEAQAAGNSLNDSNQCASAGCATRANSTIPFACVTNVQANLTDAVACPNPNSIPLSGLFSGTGIVFIIIMAALFILVIRGFMKAGK